MRGTGLGRRLVPGAEVLSALARWYERLGYRLVRVARLAELATPCEFLVITTPLAD